VRSGPGRLLLAAGLLSVAACGAPAAVQDTGTARAADIVETEIPEEELAPPATSLTQPTAAPSAPADDGTWPTRWGPLSAADRDLIKKVRLATLWEMTISQEAVQRGDSAKVRTISAEISEQHHTLDVEARELARRFDIRLPVEPTEAQQRWMADISGREGRDYDVTFVKWLRLAHGQIFPAIGAVRGSTQNTLVREFAESCNAAVLNHQRLLESTGLAGPDAFPTPPAVQK
jgi:predicted outer membrane protein